MFFACNVLVFAVIYIFFEFLALKIEIFNYNFLENYSDSAHTVKYKNAPFFLNFPNIYKLLILLSDWTGPLSYVKFKTLQFPHLLCADGTPQVAQKVAVCTNLIPNKA